MPFSPYSFNGIIFVNDQLNTKRMPMYQPYHHLRCWRQHCNRNHYVTEMSMSFFQGNCSGNGLAPNRQIIVDLVPQHQVASPALSGLYHFIHFNSIQIFHRWQGCDGYRGHVTHQMFPGIQSELTIGWLQPQLHVVCSFSTTLETLTYTDLKCHNLVFFVCVFTKWQEPHRHKTLVQNWISYNFIGF